IQRLEIARPTVTGDDDRLTVAGEVLRVDRFGNLVTNIDRRTFDKVGGGALDIRIGDYHVGRVVSTYSDAPAGEICALFASTGHLEIAANGASAASELAAGRGALVTVARHA